MIKANVHQVLPEYDQSNIISVKHDSSCIYKTDNLVSAQATQVIPKDALNTPVVPAHLVILLI